MAGNGPERKDPERRARTNKGPAMIPLPAAGRTGTVPKWPLAADAKIDADIEILKLGIREMNEELKWEGTSRARSAMRRRITKAKKDLARLEAMRKAAGRVELEIWRALWKTPQATQWEKRKWYREVALYARHQAKGECGSLDDSKEARQREDRLGLNDKAMKHLGWYVPDSSAAGRAPERRSTRGSTKYRDLRVVS